MDGAMARQANPAARRAMALAAPALVAALLALALAGPVAAQHMSLPEGVNCIACHRQVMEGAHTHIPAADGSCTACHNLKAGRKPFLSTPTAGEVCAMCHPDQSRAAAGKAGHAPASECTSCHDPHSSAYPRLLKAQGAELCFACHPDLRDRLGASGANVHQPVAGGDCSSCHDPHGTGRGALLKAEEAELCYSCHGEIKKQIQGRRYPHGPVAGAKCTPCHAPHAGVDSRLLVAAYPEGPYAPYSRQVYALCLKCHQVAAFEAEQATRETGFRHGTRNLHYVHVHRDPKGRTCLLCHEVHASDQVKHIRQNAPFGQWNLPIGFQPQGNGGTCAAGCHKVLSYDRSGK